MKNVPLETLRLYWRQVRKYKPSFFGMLIAIPLAVLCIDTIVPYLLSQAVGMFSTNPSGVWPYIWLATGTMVGGVGLNLIGFQSAVHHESSVRRDLTQDTFARLLQKDYTFFSNQKVGSLTSKFIDFINAHVQLQDLFILRTLSFVLSMTVGLVLIFQQSMLLGAILLLLTIGLLVQIRMSLKMRAPYRAERKTLVAEVNGVVADSISNYLTVKTFAHEAVELSTVGTLAKKYKHVYIKDLGRMALEGSGRILVMGTVQVMTISIIATLLLNGRIELGIAIFVVMYLQRVGSQIFSLGDIINGYDKIFLQAAPMTEILLEKPAITNASSRKLIVGKGSVAFSGVSYHYSDDADQTVLDDISLHIPAGQKVGLVGASGAGKTTITKLLLRFDDVSAGSISIDDTDIRTVTQESLRENIAYVPQEPLLFHRTLRENIAYGRHDATESEIIAAIKHANAYEFIQHLPKGLDTVVGERGIKLSGGQRQRVAIARAILKDAPLLVLDEATSALDSESEVLIQKSLRQLMKGRTSIVIAHRLSTVATLDRIIVLDGGRVAQDGTHSELLAQQDGVYAKLWRHQSGGFLSEE